MADESKPEEKKIIIDEDWKSQVEAEKEASGESDDTAEDTTPESTGEAGAELPPPNLVFLASSLYLQGMVSLGMLPNPAKPDATQPEVHLNQARHAIDTLQMLQEKTEGNRTPQETTELETMLHELRMAFLAMQQQ